MFYYPKFTKITCKVRYNYYIATPKNIILAYLNA